jgi:hypothetical protein
MDDASEQEGHYEYYLLGHVTPVRVAFDKANRTMGAEVPDAASPSGLRHAATYLHRLEVGDSVEEIDKDAFEAQCRVYREQQKKRDPSVKTIL